MNFGAAPVRDDSLRMSPAEEQVNKQMELLNQIDQALTPNQIINTSPGM